MAMAEYIERKRAIVDACNSLELYPSEYAKLEDSLNEISAADVAPVVHGRWIFKQDKEFPCFGKAICSECRNVISISPDLLDVDYQRFFAGQKHYCYNCGAKMDIK